MDSVKHLRLYFYCRLPKKRLLVVGGLDDESEVGVEKIVSDMDLYRCIW